jgi:hypothetical protein
MTPCIDFDVVIGNSDWSHELNADCGDVTADGGDDSAETTNLAAIMGKFRLASTST